MRILPQVPEEARRAFMLDSASGVFHGIFMGGIFPFLGVIARGTLQASPLLIALIAAAPFIGFLATPYWAAYTERGSRKVAMVVWSSAISRLLLLFLFFTNSALSFVGVVLVSSIIPPFCMPAYTSLLKAIYPDQWRGRLTSLVRVVITGASMLAALAAGFLLAKWRFQVVLPVVVFVSLVGPLVFFSRIPEPEHDATTSPTPTRPWAASLAILREDRAFAKFSLAFLVIGFGNMAYLPLVPILQVDEMQITTQWVGTLATLTALCSGLSFYYWGKAIDKKGPIACSVISTVLWLVLACGYVIVPNLLGLVPLAIIMGVAMSVTELAMLNAVLQFSPPGRIPRYSSVHYTFLGIRGVFAPLAGGVLAEVMHLRLIFALCAGMILVGMMLLLQVARNIPQAEEAGG